MLKRRICNKIITVLLAELPSISKDMDVFAQLKSHWYVHSTHSYNSMEVLPHGVNMVITSMLEPMLKSLLYLITRPQIFYV